VAITQPEIIVYSHIALYNFVVVVQTLRKKSMQSLQIKS